MKQEETVLLLKDLCARLPYRVKVRICDDFDSNIEILTEVDIEENRINGEIDTFYCIDNVKPYLRQMYSMTEEEKKELGNFAAARAFASQNKNPLFQLTREALLGDFFNKHHFDYRGLIEKGLALEAPEDMYK